ncbi:hypothetical protein M2475_001187 [Breznakia sp. PF5-3]|uniref:hypothetical protein n=1 Tax=unclassified Breznakia TaxID=2623764 RepID=UPI00240492B1|nr:MULTISPECIES: hypothetical protein [unclassified Breznakia]MDL2276224.1 hypothetical protein [Breznakia sp. OttesenSCG-928-G09]MDF9824882.1 hypothetical protein [Breznakia sp. PM6-1]MDF9835619.1 hypothetical protein [Breznakia sp. PF5-3]MDF9837338.1 hypothetical protein [Breznakia sp. PFB2-8]MDF9859273.1 hypothetical protein [Breznakia sp. PH5-24]
MENKKTSKKGIIIVCSILVVLGIVSNIVEQNIDKHAIKKVVTTHLEEKDDERIQFEDNEYQGFLEEIGF